MVAVCIGHDTAAFQPGDLLRAPVLPLTDGGRSRIGIYEYVRESVLKREADGSFPLHKAVLGGMFSGGLAQFLSSPTDLLKVMAGSTCGGQRGVYVGSEPACPAFS